MSTQDSKNYDNFTGKTSQFLFQEAETLLLIEKKWYWHFKLSF